MRTFSIQTLGCKVNHYESEQIATLLRARGMVPAEASESADLRVVNTCSVTMQAASKSRLEVRRSTRLKVLGNPQDEVGSLELEVVGKPQSRVIVTGCWATSDREQAKALPGVDAVIGHDDDVNLELNRVLDEWGQSGLHSVMVVARGAVSLPLLGERQNSHQRAMLKVQDGCDAHCSYCIIPQLRTNVWSKPIDHAVAEARRMVDAGHVEIVLTGIFLGAFGQSTALRRRQTTVNRLGELTNALCTQVPGLRRLRFSSLEPGDLTPDLIAEMKSHPQVVPHFHLPLQSGSDFILHRMNRQYTRDDYLRMIDNVHDAFDRPAITTDIIVGFPGETDAEFERTLDVVERVKFIHIHGFSFSPRPGTAAARWMKDFVRGPIVNERINRLTERGSVFGYEFRQAFVGQTVELLVESPKTFDTLRHGRAERYFDVWFEDAQAKAGDAVEVVIDRVTPQRTFGKRLVAAGV